VVQFDMQENQKYPLREPKNKNEFKTIPEALTWLDATQDAEVARK
jgi:hypothetical protein